MRVAMKFLVRENLTVSLVGDTKKEEEEKKKRDTLEWILRSFSRSKPTVK